VITKEQHPVGWSALMYELEDAQEHLGRLIAEITSDPSYDEANLRVDLGHVFSHLNRAWHGRDAAQGLAQEQWAVASKFPQDLEPV
jgi:hypothetical protein